MAYSVTIDLHGETRESGRKILTQRLNTLPKDTREVVVIHGYHSGTALQSMVRSFKHPKVERRIIGLNNGETIFLIKKI
jgi:DNA-nicking Smr family endonuclease